MSCFKFLLFLFLCFISSNSYAEKQVITFAIGASPSSPFYKALNEIFEEAFSTIDIDYKSIPCIPINCGRMVVEGAVDGEPIRPASYDKFYPSLLKVDGTYFTEMLLASICRPDRPRIDTLDKLKKHNYKVAFQFGYRSLNNLVPKYLAPHKFQEVTHWKIGLNLLKSGDIDCYLAIQQVEILEMRSLLDNSFVVNSIITPATNTTYTFTNKKHRSIAKKLGIAIQDMKKSGKIKNILEKYNIPNRRLIDWYANQDN